jgi:hypothetical protein
MSGDASQLLNRCGEAVMHGESTDGVGRRGEMLHFSKLRQMHGVSLESIAERTKIPVYVL